MTSFPTDTNKQQWIAVYYGTLFITLYSGDDFSSRDTEDCVAIGFPYGDTKAAAEEALLVHLSRYGYSSEQSKKLLEDVSLYPIAKMA